MSSRCSIFSCKLLPFCLFLQMHTYSTYMLVWSKVVVTFDLNARFRPKNQSDGGALVTAGATNVFSDLLHKFYTVSIPPSIRELEMIERSWGGCFEHPNFGHCNVRSFKISTVSSYSIQLWWNFRWDNPQSHPDWKKVFQNIKGKPRSACALLTELKRFLDKLVIWVLTYSLFQRAILLSVLL